MPRFTATLGLNPLIFISVVERFEQIAGGHHDAILVRAMRTTHPGSASREHRYACIHTALQALLRRPKQLGLERLERLIAVGVALADRMLVARLLGTDERRQCFLETG